MDSPFTRSDIEAGDIVAVRSPKGIGWSAPQPGVTPLTTDEALAEWDAIIGKQSAETEKAIRLGTAAQAARQAQQDTDLAELLALGVTEGLARRLLRIDPGRSI